MSIGTNDLACSISWLLIGLDDEVTSLYDPTNPAVLLLIKQVIETCKKSNIGVTVCGRDGWREIIY